MNIEHIQQTGASIQCHAKCNLFCAKCSPNCVRLQLLKLNIFGMHLESIDSRESFVFVYVLESFAFGANNLEI